MEKVIAVLMFTFLLLPQTVMSQQSDNMADRPEQEDAKRYFNQAEEYYKAGNLEKALQYFTKTIELSPEDVPEHAASYFSRAHIYNNQNKYDLAIADYQKVTMLLPKFASAYGNLGWIFILQGKFDEAREVSKKAHELDPSSYAWAVNLGHTFLLTGDSRKARDYYEKVLLMIKNDENPD